MTGPAHLRHGSTPSIGFEKWDSLTHINLIVAIEKEFRIRFTTSEVSGLKNVGELEALVENRVQK
jgi:acyl carrier protein